MSLSLKILNLLKTRLYSFAAEKKKLQLAEKYQELKKSGKLENFLSKKRKRNAVKDRRKLPKQLQKKAA